MITASTAADAPRVVALLKAVYDESLVTEAGVRYRIESANPEDRVGRWRAERDGQLVGWAVGGLDVFASVRTAGFADVVVHPAHRRAGIGARLWSVLSDHLDEIGASRVVGHSRADADTIAFLRARGCGLAGTITSSAVDPRLVAGPETPPAGVGLASMAEFLDRPELVFASDRESALDEPGPSDYYGTTYDTWRRLIWDNPDCDHELSSLALADGVVVGTSFLYTDREAGRAANAGTGVRRSYRGRGLGIAMKRHSLSRAAAAGVTQVITQNDETNAPMLAINAKLGYQPFSVGHSWVLER